MDYKYKLQKYNGLSSRIECPTCKTKRSFALYVDEMGQTLHPTVGRCNREDKCSYHYTPKEYFTDNPDRQSRSAEFVANQHRAEPTKPPKEICRIPKQYLIESLGYDSNFVKFLCSLFDKYTLESPTIENIMQHYYLGHSKAKEVIFWSIDTEKRIRSGKIMQYDPTTGKRIKNASIAVDWVHSRLKKASLLPDSWELTQCFFAEHLLNKYPNEPINIVESEKSATIAFATLGGVWIATGGKQGLNADKCKVLKGRSVTLYPDLGAFNEWAEKGHRIAKEIGFTLRVSDLLERTATDADRLNGLDIADYLIRELQTVTPIEQIKEPFTVEELNLQAMTRENPNIIHLIQAFDLVSASTGKQLKIS